MNIRQIEKFYASFYPKWKKEAFYELVGKLKITPTQRISRMSCGQRSQIALGLILAQDPELLILDDFSLGLDPGYRRLFVDYLREYARALRGCGWTAVTADPAKYGFSNLFSKLEKHFKDNNYPDIPRENFKKNSLFLSISNRYFTLYMNSAQLSRGFL